jgi:hypothetical protein
VLLCKHLLYDWITIHLKCIESTYNCNKTILFSNHLSYISKNINFPNDRFLRTECLDFETAIETVSTVQKIIQGIRENCVMKFEKLYSNVESLSENCIFLQARNEKINI